MPLFHASAAAGGHSLLVLFSLLKRLVDAEAGRPPSRRELLERREEFPDDDLRWHKQKCAIALNGQPNFTDESLCGLMTSAPRLICCIVRRRKQSLEPLIASEWSPDLFFKESAGEDG